MQSLSIFRFRVGMVQFVLAMVVMIFARNAFGQESGDSSSGRKEGADRMQWWRDAKFGMFIHWGLYSIPAGEWDGKTAPGASEWIIYQLKIPPAEYRARLLPKFDPTKFDAEEWARIAKNAGMKYLVITTKHHDGFSLYPSKVNLYNVSATPFNRDIMKEISEACRRQGIRIGWYHSILDWSHPDANREDWPKYAKVLRGQVDELLTSYGPIDIMWFDGEWTSEWTEEQGRELYEHIRKISPNTIINNRVGKGRAGMAGVHDASEHVGDFGTPEQQIPGNGIPGYDWETCMTMNDSWGFKASDHHWKSTERLIRNLVDTTSKGGNYLLNVGPTSEGLIPEASVTRLSEMGDWLRVNGDSIYGAHASPFKRLAWGRCTVDGDYPARLYFHIFDWPKSDGVLRIPGLMNKVKVAWILQRGPSARLRTVRDRGGLMIRVGKKIVDLIDTVVVVDLEGTPEIVSIPIFQDTHTGVVTLEAGDGEIHGLTARYEVGNGKDNIGYWSNREDAVSWDFEILKPVEFNIKIEYACDKGVGGSKYEVRFRSADERFDQSFGGTVVETGSWTSFIRKNLGKIKIEAPGVYSVTVIPQEIANGALMNLKGLELEPTS